MSYQSDMTAGFQDAQRTLGNVTAAWRDQPALPIIAGDNATMLLLIPGGFLEEFQFGFQCLASQLPAQARGGDPVTVAGQAYRVLKIIPQSGSPLVNVFCGGPNQ